MTENQLSTGGHLLEPAANSIVFTGRDDVRLSEGDIAWYAYDYSAGEECGHRDKEWFELPGAERLLLALTVAVLAAEGACSLDDRVPIRSSRSQPERHGLLARLQPGKILSLREALTLSVILADELAQTALIEALAAANIDLGLEYRRVCAIAGNGELAMSSGHSQESNAHLALRGTPRGLWSAFSMLLVAAYPQAGIDFSVSGNLRLPQDVARELIEIFASVYDEGDGLAALFPGYGPFSTEAPHLLVDSGRPGARAGGTFVDVCAPVLDGRPAFTVAAVCPSVAGTVCGLPGGYVARKSLAMLGRQLWNLHHTSPEAAAV